jgi:hypothetical protein
MADDDGAMRSAWGLEGFEREDVFEPLRPVSFESGAVRFLENSQKKGQTKTLSDSPLLDHICL